MEKRMKFIKDFFLWLIAISVLITVMMGNSVAFYGSVFIYVLVTILTEKYMSDYVRKNPYEVTAKIIRMRYGTENDLFTIEYEVDGITYEKKIGEAKLRENSDYKKRNFNLGDEIKVYIAKELPSHVLSTLRVNTGDLVLFRIIVSSITVVVLAIAWMFIVEQGLD